MTQRTRGLVSFATSLLGDDPGINEIFFLPRVSLPIEELSSLAVILCFCRLFLP